MEWGSKQDCFVNLMNPRRWPFSIIQKYIWISSTSCTVIWRDSSNFDDTLPVFLTSLQSFFQLFLESIRNVLVGLLFLLLPSKRCHSALILIFMIILIFIIKFNLTIIWKLISYILSWHKIFVDSEYDMENYLSHNSFNSFNPLYLNPLHVFSGGWVDMSE